MRWERSASLTPAPLRGGDRGAAANYGRWGTPAVTELPIGEDDRIDFNQGPSRVIDEHTARYAELLDLMAATADHDVFTDLALQAERILADQVVALPVVTRTSFGALRTDRIGGYVHLPWNDLGNVEEWERIDR